MKRKFLLVFTCVIFILIIIISPILYLKVSFKTSFSNIIIQNLQEINNENITKNLVLSVIKTESNFNIKAKSSSDAYGLMQLQFLTAKDVANNLGINITLQDLYNPEINIKLGIKYLDYLFNYFNNKQLALISYNAGLNKVNSWIDNNELTIKNEVYITPYKETTNYLKKVLQNEKIYNLIKG